MTITAGIKLGRYEIRAKIGEGGMGEVYLAQDTKLDRKVALKILPAEVAAHPDRMRRFVQEAKTASALNHPGIITIYEIEQIDSVNFIATEFIDGDTLRESVKNGPLKLGEVCSRWRFKPRARLRLLMPPGLCIAISSPRTSCCGATAS